MKAKGGKREGSGRKPKTKELELIDALTPYDKIAQEKLIEGVIEGSFNHLKLFYEYRHGKPKQMIDVTTNGDNLTNIPVAFWMKEK
jgi:hypothetical protein